MAANRFFFFFITIMALTATPALAEESPLFRFGVLTDIQYADQEPQGDLHYRASLRKLEEAVNNLNQEDLAFVIHLGDFIDGDFQSYDTLLPIWNRLKTVKYHALGNHDYAVSEALKQSVPEKLGIVQNYYDFSKKGWRFIVLDGNELSFHAHKQGSKAHSQSKKVFEKLKASGASNALIFNGAMSEAQLDWLGKKLTHACVSGERAVIFSHYPVYPKHTTNLWNDEKLIAVLESHDCVLAYMNGHEHAGSYGVRNGIHYVTLHGMVMTPQTSAYAIVEVYKAEIKIIGHGREPSRALKPEAGDFAAPIKSAAVQGIATQETTPDATFNIQPLRESRAYQMYQKRSKSELSKLIYLIDRFSDMKVTIIYDGVEYDTDFSRKVARRYLQRKYKKENVKKWIAMHAYRSQHAGDIIRVKFPNGREEILKDVFIEELEALEGLSIV